MDALSFEDAPELRDPVLVVAFYGWNDAAEAATDAVRYLRRSSIRAGGTRSTVATIDSEEFFVFTEQRPTVRIVEGETRELTWPVTDFTVARQNDGERDFILGIGTEPHLKWKTFAAQIMAVAHHFGAKELLSLGALLADTPHTRPVPVSGGSSDPKRAKQLGFESSRYEGPTGILGALGDACRREGLEQVSLWASVPHYISGGKNPKATHALLTRLNEVYELRLDLSDLERRGRRYETQVTEALRESPDVLKYVTDLEDSSSDDDETTADLPADGTPLSSRDVLDEVNRLLAGDDPDAD